VSEPPSTPDRAGALAGAAAVVLFVAGAVLTAGRPAFGEAGLDLSVWLAYHRTETQVACALFALVGPPFVWFLATVAALARARGEGARRAATVAFGCGIVFLTLFLADVTALAVSAVRPERGSDALVLLRDFELLAMGVAAPAAAAVPAAFAVLALRYGALWPRWVGWLCALAVGGYMLRVGTLFTVEGPFAADGLLGLWVPVTSIAVALFVASVVLARGSMWAR
jgi:hypothetical protein